MSELVLVSPVLLHIAVFGTVVIVALRKARSEDVPTVLRECASVFRDFAGRGTDTSRLIT